MKGSEWWRDEVPEQLGDGYLAAILQAIDDGHAVIDWMVVEHGGLEYTCMRAPLAIGDADDHVFLFGLSGYMVDVINDKLDIMRLTPLMWDHAARESKQVGPHTLPTLLGQQNGAAGMTKTAAKAHSDAVLRDRPESCSNIMGCCKTYVIWPYGDSDGIRDDHDVEYGWRLRGKVGWGSRNSTSTGWVVQSAQWAHLYRRFWDYSMGLVGMKKDGKAHGAAVYWPDISSSASLASSCGLPRPSGFVHLLEANGQEDIYEGPETDRSPDLQYPTLQLGSKGPEVARWQRVLLAAGFDLGRWRDDGDFGTMTHNATVGWKSERGLSKNGIVDEATWEARDLDPLERDVPDGDITDTIIATNYTHADRNEVDVLVIHTIEIVEASTSGDNCAKWFASGERAPRASAHYCFDDDSTILCVPEEHVAWAAPGANGTHRDKIQGVQYEHAGYARQTAAQWEDPFSRRMLQRSAKRAARTCKRWGIPVEFRSAAELDKLAAGDKQYRGITTHYQVTKGPGKGRTTHHDPGRHFPMTSYLAMVRAEMAAME